MAMGSPDDNHKDMACLKRALQEVRVHKQFDRAWDAQYENWDRRSSVELEREKKRESLEEAWRLEALRKAPNNKTYTNKDANWAALERPGIAK